MCFSGGFLVVVHMFQIIVEVVCGAFVVVLTGLNILDRVLLVFDGFDRVFGWQLGLVTPYQSSGP